MNKFFRFNETVKSAFNNEEEQFVNFNKLLVDAAHNNLADGLTAREANDVIVAKFRAAIGCDEHSSKKEIRQAIRRNQVQIFEILEDTIQDQLVSGWGENPFFMEYVDVRNLALGDKNEFYMEDDSILSVMKLAGNHHDIIRQRLGAGEVKSIPTYWAGVKIYSEFERLLTGAEDWARFVGKVTEAYNLYIYDTLFATLSTQATALGTQFYKSAALSAETEATLRTLCQDIEMATGCEVVIMGTRVALGKVCALQNVSWASNEMKNEKNRTGRFGYWEGLRLVELAQGFKRKDLSKRLLRDDMLFIVPVADNKFIKLVNEGDSQVYQITDAGTNMDMTYSYELQTKIGVGVIEGLKWGAWEIL